MVRGGRMIAKCPICGTKMKKTSQSDIYSYYRCKNGHRLLWTPEQVGLFGIVNQESMRMWWKNDERKERAVVYVCVKHKNNRPRNSRKNCE